MYKVFFNDSTFQIGVESKKSSKNNITQTVDLENHGFVRDLITEIEKGSKAIHFLLQNNKMELLWECFKRQFVQIPAAGGLVKNSDRSLLFIKRLGVWDLPKGKIDKGETPEIAAIREVEEECAVKGLKIIRQLDSTFHIYRSPFLKFPDNLVLKETKWFLMSCDDDQTLVPQSDENIEEVRWFAVNELDTVMENTYLSLREFLSKTIPLI
ncbi:MAG: NUDIX domain-containing protein [Prolixibacteraceae bacterium]|nr:NUDIX domain-containing protein [Prolixibacteraceae bacterium]